MKLLSPGTEISAMGDLCPLDFGYVELVHQRAHFMRWDFSSAASASCQKSGDELATGQASSCFTHGFKDFGRESVRLSL